MTGAVSNGGGADGPVSGDGTLIASLQLPPSERFADPRAGRYDLATMQTQAPKTWEDVPRMPDDGNRYEFIGGRLYVTRTSRGTSASLSNSRSGLVASVWA
ncbi:MAG: hypothetical protein OXR05_18180 [Gemmatimonadota bacterium]|nr:hypothetical protein [Gemmatimonadota bacterium]